MIPEFTNFDLQNICTPVNPEVLKRMLLEANYDMAETEFLYNGFKFGFDIGYKGPKVRTDQARNIPFTVGNKFIMWEKIMKEVEAGRYAGPYKEPPYKRFIQSPIGLVPKAGNKTRLIFHLSYTFKESGNESVNFWTPEELCSVHYNDLDHAITNSLRVSMGNNRDQGEPQARTLFYGKSDLLSAFRVLPLSRRSWRWTLLRARHPVTNELLYFVNKNLPFGAAISCAHFTKVSNGLRHLVEFHAGTKGVVTNYLDDFLFIATSTQGCNKLVRIFLNICQAIQFPVSMDKTEWASLHVVFLGILLLGDKLKLSIPLDKQQKALGMLEYLINKKKAKISELERLAGFLNFLNKAIIPGRTFTRRMYSKFAGILNQDGKRVNRNIRSYHHVRLDNEFKNDCKVWVLFLNHLESVCRPFSDVNLHVDMREVGFYSDASRNGLLGFWGSPGFKLDLLILGGRLY